MKRQLVALALALAVGAPAQVRSATGDTIFTCAEDKGFRATFSSEPEGVRVAVDGQDSFLPAVRAVTGVKYSDGRTTLWLEGANGLAEVDGQVVRRDCQPVRGPALLEPGGFLFGEVGFGFTLPAAWADRGYRLRVLPKAEATAHVPGAQWMIRFTCTGAKDDGRGQPLLEIIVFDPEGWHKLLAESGPTAGFELGRAGTRVWAARLPKPEGEPACRSMQLTQEQVKRGFFTLVR